MRPRVSYYYGEKAANDFAKLIKEVCGVECRVAQIGGEFNTWGVVAPTTVELRKFKLLKKAFDAGHLSGSNFAVIQ